MSKRIIDEPLELTEQTARRLIETLDRTTQTGPVRHIRGNQIASAFLGAIGLALFVVGVERAAEDIPFISNPYGSIFIGIVLLVTTGALLTRLGGPDSARRSPHRSEPHDDDGEG
jgi:hypothetical protein